MGKRGGSRHLKRYAAPKYYPILRKEGKFVTKPYPGKKNSIPIGVALSFLAKKKKDIKKMLNEGAVKVDGKVVRELKFPVTLMDVISVNEKNYRVIINNNGKYYLIECKNPNVKSCRIENKYRAKGNKIKVTTHDGRNFELKNSKDANVLDSLVISLPDCAITGISKLEAGSKCIVIGGKWVGMIGKIKEIDEKTKIVTIESNELFRTSKKNVFPIESVDW